MYKIQDKQNYFFEIPIFSILFLVFSICGCPKTQASFGIIWVGTPVPLAVETTQGGFPMKKTPKNTSDVKIFKQQKNVLDFVHKGGVREGLGLHNCCRRRAEIRNPNPENGFNLTLLLSSVRRNPESKPRKLFQQKSWLKFSGFGVRGLSWWGGCAARVLCKPRCTRSPPLSMS